MAQFTVLGSFALGILAGIFGTIMFCLLCHREKHASSFDVVLGNVQESHKIEVTFKKKGGR